ncbi:MAG TPA: 4-(cytidine 5'-diphospho)-2-C-methyl-D-erythritol kinase [Bacilli bacterium]
MIVYEKAPAKINLSLDILGKRADGYHEVEMVMASIDLFDRLELAELTEDRIVVSSQAGFIPLDERNLAYQAADLMKREFNIKQGVKIHIDKRIPVAAGLAGGSSDAAATLRGLNRLWKLDIPLTQLAELSATLGSDVPYCVTGGTAVARGRGEALEKLPSPPACWVVLARPPLTVSTADIYEQYRVGEGDQPRFTKGVVQAVYARDFHQLCHSLGNHLESVTLRLYPQVNKIKRTILQMGADGALMSGSGPAVFALANRESKAKRMMRGLRGFCRDVYMVRLLV